MRRSSPTSSAPRPAPPTTPRQLCVRPACVNPRVTRRSRPCAGFFFSVMSAGFKCSAQGDRLRAFRAWMVSCPVTDLSRSTDLTGFPGPAVDGRFFRPPLPAGYVRRPRLCERLEEGMAGRLLLISAPAGFGKSSLASEFCERLPERWQSLWLGLSRRDGDPGRFLERLLEGLRQHFPGMGDEALG